MRIFGIDPGSGRTGYGCVESDGRRHQLVACGAITALAGDPFPQRLAKIHRELTALLTAFQPDCVAVENVFHSVNARSALKLGHARGVAILAAVEAGCEVVEYTPAAVKLAVVGFGRAQKHQVQQMIKLLLGLDEVPSPHDAADALAVAICHVHSMPVRGSGIGARGSNGLSRGAASASSDSRSLIPDPRSRAAKPRSWRQYRPPANG